MTSNLEFVCFLGATLCWDHGDNLNLTILETAPSIMKNVCGETKCMVVVVSGRHLAIDPYLSSMDAPVAVATWEQRAGSDRCVIWTLRVHRKALKNLVQDCRSTPDVCRGWALRPTFPFRVRTYHRTYQVLLGVTVCHLIAQELCVHRVYFSLLDWLFFVSIDFVWY